MNRNISESTGSATGVVFVFLAVSLAFVNPFHVRFLGQSIQLTDAVFLLLAVLLAAAWATGKRKIRYSLFYLPLAVYLAALLLSLVVGAGPGKSWLKFVGVVYLAGLAAVSFVLAADKLWMKRVILAWVWAAFLASCVSVVTALLFYVDSNNGLLAYTLSHYGTLPAGNYPRIRSTFMNANMFAHYLNISAILALAAIRLGWLKRRTGVLVFLIILFAAAFTISPAIGGFFLGIGSWFYVAYRDRGKPVFAHVSLGIALVVSVLFVLATTVDLKNSGQIAGGTSARVLTWSSSGGTFIDNPIVGKGIGSDAAHAHYGDQLLQDAHNLYLNVAAQTGIIGLAAILFFGIHTARNAFPFSQVSDDAALRTALGIAFICAFFYQGLTGSYEDARHLWVLAGLLAAAGRTRPD